MDGVEENAAAKAEDDNEDAGSEVRLTMRELPQAISNINVGLGGRERGRGGRGGRRGGRR